MIIRDFPERRFCRFRDKLPPLTGRIIRFREKFNGILESIKVRFWANTALQIQVIPFIEKLGSGQRTALVDFHSYPLQTRDFLDGDDEMETLNVKIAYKKDEIIGFIVHNIHGTNSYDYNLGYEFILLDK